MSDDLQTESATEAQGRMPAPPTGRHRTARDALVCVGVCVLLLLAAEGQSVRHSGEAMKHGWQRTAVLAVGRPAAAVSSFTGLGGVKNHLVTWARSGQDGSGGPGGFAGAGAPRGVPPVTPDAFDPQALGVRPRPPGRLRTVLITGDSMAQPLDAKLARSFAASGADVKVDRDARIGTAISQPEITDWGRVSGQQVRKDRPQAVVVFLGANEGFPMTVGHATVSCCGVAWVTEYANRVRQMMSTYRQAGTARVYWLLLPLPRSAARQRISRAVNAAVTVAAEAFRAQVRTLDLPALFTPGGVYRVAMPVGGHATIVREPDGVHLNDAGSQVALGPVLRALRADFGASVPR